MDRISNRPNNENSDNTSLPAPPPYTSVLYKLDGNQFDRVPPPSYSDIDNQSVVYINNYPGPPITDGHVQVTRDNISINQETIISKKIRIFIVVNGIITILFGIMSIGIQIGILTTKSIIYYYYGFWAGALIIGIGISTVVLYHRPHTIDYLKLFNSFFWQMIIIAIIFGIGIIIIITDKCNDNSTENDSDDGTCRHSHKILNGFLIGIFAAAFLQSVINSIVFGILKKQRSFIRNSSA